MNKKDRYELNRLSKFIEEEFEIQSKYQIKTNFIMLGFVYIAIGANALVGLFTVFNLLLFLLFIITWVVGLIFIVSSEYISNYTIEKRKREKNK